MTLIIKERAILHLENQIDYRRLTGYKGVRLCYNAAPIAL